jgi:hypothetical protein
MPCIQKGVFAFVINTNVLLEYRYQYFDKVRKILTGNITNAPLGIGAANIKAVH